MTSSQHAILNEGLSWWHDFIVNMSYDIITLINRDYTYEAVSKSFVDAQDERVPSEVIGHRVSEIWGEDKFVELIKPNLDKAFAGKTVQYKSRFPFGNLGEKEFAVTVAPYYSKGEVSHVVVISREREPHAD